MTLRSKHTGPGTRERASRGFFAHARYGAVLLDLDGCLLDSNDAHARAWSRALSRFGLRVPAARIRGDIGKGGQELLREFLTDAERQLLGVALGRTQTRFYLERFRTEVRPIPGAAAAVRQMRRAGLPVVLASSGARDVVERSLKALRLEGVVTGFTTSDDVDKAKPFDDVFSLAIRRFRLGSRRPAAVGDTPYDIAAAHQIGVPCLALESGGFPHRTLRCAESVFADLADLWRRGRELFA